MADITKEQVPGVPDGYRLVSLGPLKPGDLTVDGAGEPKTMPHGFLGWFRPIIERIEPELNANQQEAKDAWDKGYVVEYERRPGLWGLIDEFPPDLVLGAWHKNVWRIYRPTILDHGKQVAVRTHDESWEKGVRTGTLDGVTQDGKVFYVNRGEYRGCRLLRQQ